MATRHHKTHAFTLIELLVVITITVALVSLLAPSLVKARAVARKTMCLSNLRQQGICVAHYCNDQKDTAFPLTTRWSRMWMIRMTPYMGFHGDATGYTTGQSRYSGGMMCDAYGYANSPEALFPVFKCPEARKGTTNVDSQGDYGINTILTSTLNYATASEASWELRRTFSQITCNPALIPLIYDHPEVAGELGNFNTFDRTLEWGSRIVGHENRTMVNSLYVDGHAEGIKKGWRTNLWFLDGKNKGWD